MRRSIWRLRGEPHPLALFAATDIPPAAHADGLSHWQAIAGWLLTKKGTIRRSVTKKQGFPTHGSAADTGLAEREERKRAMEALLSDLAAIPGLASSLHLVRNLPPPQYDAAAWQFIAALLSVLPRVAARLKVVFAQTNAIDFSEATLTTLAALGNGDAPSQLLLALDARIEHLLVDEFQDTSLAQYDLIKASPPGGSPATGGRCFWSAIRCSRSTVSAPPR